jgi:predicted RNA-binding Zn-ribbon protein involved in translation (DUF1610 family)
MSKKPAKKPSTPAVSVPKVDEGTLVRFIGAFKGVTYSCPYCGSLKRKAMMRDYKGTLYCSRSCVQGVKRKEESNEK